MRRAPSPRRPGPAALALALAGLGLATGCTHNHYYGTSPAFVVPGETVIIDDLCEIPSLVGSGTPSRVARSESTATASAEPGFAADSRPARVVISRPSSGPIVGGGGWNALGRGPRLVTTEVHGNASDTLVR